MKQKFILTLLCLAFAINSNVWAQTFVDEEIEWTFNAENGALHIYGNGAMKDYSYDGTNKAPWLIHSSSIKSVTIDGQLTRIGNYAFYKCSVLETVDFNAEGLHSIGDNAFAYCEQLKQMVLPNSIVELGVNTFAYCSSLEQIQLSENLMALPGGLLIYCTSLKELSVPNSVVEICGGSGVAYSSFTGSAIETLYLGSSLSNITGGAFYRGMGMGALNKVITNSQYVVDNFAEIFSAKNYNVTEVVIGDSIRSIGERAFENLTKLERITISDSVVAIGYNAFNATAWYDNQSNGVVYLGRVLYKYKGLMPENTNIEAKESIISISPYAFDECTGLVSIDIPEGVMSIGEGAFYGCSSLISVELPNRLTEIDDVVFTECSSLASITIPEGVTSIGDDAFDDCNSLISVILPKSLNYIGYAAFESCTNLTSINIPEGVTSLLERTFCECSSLTSIAIPESVTLIGDADGATFGGCTSLTTITLPKNIEFIGSSVFAGCVNLRDVYCHAEQLPETESDAFDYAYPQNATLHVPANAIEDYRTTTPWSNFGQIIAIGDETINKCATPAISYINGKVSLTCEEQAAEVVTEVVSDNEQIYQGLEFDFTATYTFNAYAVKNGYENSDTVSVTICWIECEAEHGQDDETDIITLPSTPVLIQTANGSITLTGLTEGSEVTVYDITGRKVASTTVTNDTATISTDLTAGSTAIVQIGKRSVKVIMR